VLPEGQFPIEDAVIDAVGVQPQFAQRGQSSDCGRFIGDETEARITCSYRSSPAQRMDASIGR
jgi:hypothetical protein